MTSYLNVKNKQGLTKLTSLLKKAGFNDVKVTVNSKSITLTPSNQVSLSAGLADLKAGRYQSFKNSTAAVDFLASRSRNTQRSDAKSVR